MTYYHKGFLGWLDRLNWWYMASIFFMMTLGGALTYTMVSKFSPDSDVKATYLKANEIDTTPTFTRSLYFSIVTEATLGYGDYRPTGLNRVVACLQVLAGYAFLGVAVSKLTSALGAQSRRLERLVCGVWYNYTIHKDGRLTIDICQIFPSQTNGNLRFCGANYSENGELLGPYESDLISASWPVLTFIYRNAPNIDLPWSEGIMTVQFVENGDKPATSFTGTMREFKDGRVDSFPGWRLDNQIDLMARLQSVGEFPGVIHELVERHRVPAPNHPKGRTTTP
jgi:hypothetical protein